MNAPSPPFPATRSRSARDLVAVLYRQAGLIAACALVGSAASLLLYAKQARVYASSAKVWVAVEPVLPPFLPGVAGYRGTPYPAPVDRGVEAEVELMRTRSSAQAVVDRLHIGDEQLVHGGLARLRAVLAGPAGAPADGRARTVDRFLEAITIEPLRSKAGDDASSVLEVKFECTDAALAPAALQAFLDNYLRLGETVSRALATQRGQAREALRRSEDEIVALLVRDSGRGVRADARTAGADGLRLDPDPGGVGGPPPGVAAPRPQALELPLRLDEAQVELALRVDPVEAETRVVIEAPDHPGLADGRRKPVVAVLGPLASLLLGLSVAALRELGGDRIRSAREAERALGAPVLGAIPTLSAKARSACLVPPAPVPADDAPESLLP